MKKIRVDKYFFRVFATVAILVLAMSGALLYVFNFLLEHQIQSRKEYLLGQSQITANAVVLEMEAFERDLYFFSSQNHYEQPLGNVMEASLVNLMSKYRNYINSITIFSNEEARRFQVDETGAVSDMYVNMVAPEFPDDEISFHR